MAEAICPGCKRDIELESRIKKGEWISCPHCWADLEVISLNPLELDWAYDEGAEVAGFPRFWPRSSKWVGW